MARSVMSAVERLYLPEIFKGLLITSRHFFKNLGLHSLHKLGLAKGKEAMVTISYPEVRRPYPLVARSRHRLTQREDGSAK